MATHSIPLSGGLSGFGRQLGKVPRWLYIALAALAVMGLIAGIIVSRVSAAPQVVTAPVVRQTLNQSVTASGTVNPQNNISVGTQVSGTISQLYVDFNSKVHKGQVLARIDPSTVQAQLSQAQANLAQAEAQAAAAGANASGASSGVAIAQANAQAQVAAASVAKTNIPKSQAALSLAQQQLNRDQQLFNQGYLPQATLQTDQSNVAQAQAVLASAQAAYVQAQAQATTSRPRSANPARPLRAAPRASRAGGGDPRQPPCTRSVQSRSYGHHVAG